MPKRNNAPIFWPLALLCLSVASCSAADTRSASAVLPAGARATSAVAVAGDSPAQFEAALRAAQRAGKTVRYVTVKSTRGADDYSVYAQIVRSEHALLVRAYGRMYVYPLTTAAVIYSASVQTVDISSIPIVDAPAIDAAFSSGTVLGVSATVRKKLCSNCAMVLVRPAHTTVDPTLWHSAKDTWQAHPDYAFWSPSSDSRPLTPDFIVGGGGGSGGCYEVIGSSVINVGPNPSGGCGPQYYYPVGRGGGGGGNPPPDIEETADAIDLLTPEQPGGDTVGFDFEQPLQGGDVGFAAVRRHTQSATRRPNQLVSLCTTTLHADSRVRYLVGYWVTVLCTGIGAPVDITTNISVYNVNDFSGPVSQTPIQTTNCSGGQTCSTAIQSFAVAGTEIVKVSAQSSMIFSRGRQVSRVLVIPIPYNNAGFSYPNMTIPEWTHPPSFAPDRKLPFPAPPFTSCPRALGSSVIGCSDRDDNFSTNLASWYSSQGYPVPIGYEAHHIKPLFLGGNNDPTTNGVFLSVSAHRNGPGNITAWWAAFNIGTATIPGVWPLDD